jgi:hypothetical protein
VTDLAIHEASDVISAKQRKAEAGDRRTQIREAFRGYGSLWDLVSAAIRDEDWKTLGFGGFQAWWQAEIAEAWETANDDDLKAPLREQVQQLLDAGVSLRCASGMLGVHPSTASRSISGKSGNESRAPSGSQVLRHATPAPQPVQPVTQVTPDAYDSAAIETPEFTPLAPPKVTQRTANCPWFGDEEWHRQAKAAVTLAEEAGYTWDGNAWGHGGYDDAALIGEERHPGS